MLFEEHGAQEAAQKLLFDTLIGIPFSSELWTFNASSLFTLERGNLKENR